MASTERPMISRPRRRSRRSAWSTTVRIRASSVARSARSSRPSASWAAASSTSAPGTGVADQARAAADSRAVTPLATWSTRAWTESR